MKARKEEQGAFAGTASKVNSMRIATHGKYDEKISLQNYRMICVGRNLKDHVTIPTPPGMGRDKCHEVGTLAKTLIYMSAAGEAY